MTRYLSSDTINADKRIRPNPSHWPQKSDCKMGLLRTLFALSVVLVHTDLQSDMLVGGQYAVQMFYMTSGFLISYVLSNNKNYRSPAIFYANRALRLYPAYFFCLALSLIAAVVGRQYFWTLLRDVPWSAKLLLIASNLTMLGQDWLFFLGVQNQDLVFVRNFHNADYVVSFGLLIPQSWTLSLELMFYLIAPFVLRRKTAILILLCLSLLLRAILVYEGVGLTDPWTFRFFPCELSLFLVGALSQQILMPILIQWTAVKRYKLDVVATALMLVLCFGFPLLERFGYVATTLLFGVFIVALPLTFMFQNNYRFDKQIGDLSYPLYLCHFLVIWAVTFFFAKLEWHDLRIAALASVVLSLIFAAAIDKFVVAPVEGVRGRLRSGGVVTAAN